jgi:hypothetical protein
VSAEATGWTFRHSPFTGATFAVHLAIADSVNDQHEHELWMSQQRLAKKARLGLRATHTAMKALLDGGYLTLLEDNARAGKADRYRFEFPAVPVAYETRGGAFNPQSGGMHEMRTGGTHQVRTGHARRAQGGTHEVRTEPNKEPKENFAHTREQETPDVAALDALSPAQRTALLKTARTTHPLLRNLKGVSDDHPMLRAAAAALLEGATR